MKFLSIIMILALTAPACMHGFAALKPYVIKNGTEDTLQVTVELVQTTAGYNALDFRSNPNNPAKTETLAPQTFTLNPNGSHTVELFFSGSFGPATSTKITKITAASARGEASIDNPSGNGASIQDVDSNLQIKAE